MAIIKSIKVITNPRGARYNANFSTQPVIHVGDLDTNTNIFTVDTLYSGSVLVGEGPGNSGYNLSGTLSKAFVQGVAAFTDLGIVPDENNTTLDVQLASLSFLTTNLNTITSSTFPISNASKLVITSTPVPTTGTLGRVIQIPVKVQFRDTANNNIALEDIPITASATGASLSGVTSLQSSSAGFVIFTQLTFTGGSQAVVTFSSPNMTSAQLTINLVSTNIIKPRRSIVAGDPPVSGDIVPFEIAINIPDRQIWVADQTGTPVLIVDGDAVNSGGGASSLVDLTDIVLTSPTNGEVLKYDTASGKWINSADATGSGGGDFLPLSGGTMTGAIIFDGTSGQYISKGTFDTSRGGNNGISLVCSIGYEFNWQAGWLRTTEQGSVTPRALYLDSGVGTSLKAWNSSDNTGTTISHLGITYPDGTTQTTASTGSGGGGSSGTGTKFTTGSTAPSSPVQGDRWVNTLDAILYTYYGSAWVQFNT